MTHLGPFRSCGLWANNSTSIWAERKYLGLDPALHGPKGSFQKRGQVTSKQGSVLELGMGAFLCWYWLLSLLGEAGLWEGGFIKYQENV